MYHKVAHILINQEQRRLENLACLFTCAYDNPGPSGELYRNLIVLMFEIPWKKETKDVWLTCSFAENVVWYPRYIVQSLSGWALH